MQKSGILFVIVGSIVGVGIILSFYGNQVIFEDLNKGEGQVKFGENLIIPVELDNTETQIKVFGVIGPEPDAGKKSLGFISLYILIIGLIGMVGVAIYAIKNRKKSFS